MNGVRKQRAGKERIESLGIPKPRLVEWWRRGDKSDWAASVAMAAGVAAMVLVLCRTWQPPFPYREGEIPSRDLITRVTFEVEDREATQVLRDRRRREVLPFYRNRTQPLANLRGALKDQLFLLLETPSYEQLDADRRRVYRQFLRPAGENAEAADGGSETAGLTDAERFEIFREVLASDPELKQVEAALDAAMVSIYKYGLLQANQHTPEQGNQRLIRVVQGAESDEVEPVELSKVRIAQVGEELRTRLREQFAQRFDRDRGPLVGSMITDWIVQRLPDYETLKYDDELSEQARAAAAASVDPVMIKYRTGQSKLATAGKPLSIDEMTLLRLEWQELVSRLRLPDRIARMLGYGGMLAGLYLLCGSYIFFLGDRSLLFDQGKFGRLLAVFAVAVTLGFYGARDQWRIELIPLVMAAILAAVVYGRELALLVMLSICLSVALLVGGDLPELVTLAAASTSCALLVGRIRSRTHLLYVGLVSSSLTIATVIGVGIVTSEPLSLRGMGDGIDIPYRGPQLDMVFAGLSREAIRAGAWILVSATAMNGLLRLVEKAFGVQTDLSLLELGDASHPLLRRLAQRAPGTYNHSINVASIGESAAEAIGVHGLLVRVGAYFHDIGKIFKPEYFIENQGSGVNQHDALQPAMSTLVIIAHVKDGADLARSHHLPQPIIDFILQHHGTTLVEYFYREATRRSEASPNGEVVSDKDFRYPGPKPQTLEAAVLMLADAVESASRTLIDPTPARIQGLVDAIAQKKVADGQFDECGLTFRQLHRIRQSLVKSLTAIYHARVKYPDQQSA